MEYSRDIFEVRRVPLAPETEQIVSFRFWEIQNFTLKTLNPNTQAGLSKLAHTAASRNRSGAR